MGIPRLLNYLSERYPCLTEILKANKVRIQFQKRDQLLLHHFFFCLVWNSYRNMIICTLI